MSAQKPITNAVWNGLRDQDKKVLEVLTDSVTLTESNVLQRLKERGTNVPISTLRAVLMGLKERGLVKTDSGNRPPENQTKYGRGVVLSTQGMEVAKPKLKEDKKRVEAMPDSAVAERADVIQMPAKEQAADELVLSAMERIKNAVSGLEEALLALMSEREKERQRMKDFDALKSLLSKLND